ncbi:hypothetical protein LINGRAHAP2_LOCUS1047 [Linum grandiflorum]
MENNGHPVVPPNPQSQPPNPQAHMVNCYNLGATKERKEGKATDTRKLKVRHTPRLPFDFHLHDGHARLLFLFF